MVRGTRASELRSTHGDPAPFEPSYDQVVHLSSVSWEDYERIDALRGESAVPRLTYVDGVLELMSPGTVHESDEKKLARLFEAYIEYLGIPAEGIGSWTVKNQKKKLGAEPDECYVFTTAPIARSLKAPDLVIEVAYSSENLERLALWRQLGAKEVWFWQDGELAVFVRRGGFGPSRRSILVPEIELDLVTRCMREKTQTAAVRVLRATLAKKQT